MFASSGDILNMSLAMGFMLLVIFICIACFYLILILRDVSKVVDDATELVTKMKSAVIQPLRALDFIMQKASPYVDMMVDQKKREKKRNKRKRKRKR